MLWLTIYLVGVVLMLILCGAAIGNEITGAKFVGTLIVAAIWPLALPVMLGAILREAFR